MHPFTRFFTLLFVLSLTLAGCKDNSGVINGAKAKELVSSGALLLDVRTPGEFSRGHIDGALNVPLSLLGENMSQLDKSKPVVVYCQSGNRSAKAVSSLKAAGFTVYDLGAMYNW